MHNHIVIVGLYVVFLTFIIVYIYCKYIARPNTVFKAQETQKKVIKDIYKRIIAPERILMRMDVSPFNAIRETEFVEKIELWDTLTLDSTYFMVQILIRLKKKDFIKQYEDKISAFTLGLFNETQQGFQINYENQDEVSVHSNHCALGILNFLSSFEKYSFEEMVGSNNAFDNKYLQLKHRERIFGFLKRCYKKGGGFAEKPRPHFLATIVDTESALWIFRLFGWLKNDSKLVDCDPYFFKSIKQFVTDLKWHGSTNNEELTLAYLNRHGNKEGPYLCAVYYALRILWEIKQANRDYTANILEDEKMGILRYVLACQNEDGGFGASPGRRSNIIHTKDALSLIYKRIELESSNNINWLEGKKQGIRNKVLEFLENCKFNKTFAFGNIKYYQPNIYAINLALDIYGYLKQEIDDEVTNSIMEFIEACFDKNRGGCRGYPVPQKFTNENSLSYNILIEEFTRYKDYETYHRQKTSV